MQKVEFEIIGTPGSKGRPRFSRVGNFVKTYTDEKTSNYENLVKWSYIQQVNRKFNDDKQLAVKIKAYFPIPKSVSKKKREQMVNMQLLPVKKPDCDNIAKIVLDSLNNIAFKDDSQVVELVVKKFYSDTPKVKVIINELQC